MKKKNFVLILIMITIIGTSFGVNAASASDCTGIFGAQLIAEVKQVFRIIQIAAPVILLLLTSFDFAKVVFNDNKDGLDKAKNNFLKRAVAVLIIFFAPYVIELVLDLVNESTMKSCLEQFK